MMKVKFILLMGLFPVIAFGQVYKKYNLQKDRLSIQLSEGILSLTPLSDKAIRVQWEKAGLKEGRELVLINKQPVPYFTFSETTSRLKLSTRAVTVLFDKKNGELDFSN